MSFDYVHDPIVGGILSYWQRLCAGRTMPTRNDIKPRDIQRQLRNVQLIEVVNGGERFRFRLLGTKLTQMFGYDFTGLYHDEVFKGERLNSLQTMYRDVCANKKPVFARTKFATAKGFDVYTNRLYLPLSEDGETVNMILGVLTFELPNETARGFHADSAGDVYVLEKETVNVRPDSGGTRALSA